MPVARSQTARRGSAQTDCPRRNHSDDGGGTSTHASLVPTGLRFINEHFAIGGTLLLAYDDFGTENAVTYGIGPAARFYPSPATNWKPFLAASIAPEWQTFSIPSQPDANQTLLGIEGSFGLTRMLATHVGLDGELFYHHSHQTSKIAATSVSRNVDSYGLRFGLSVFID